MKYTIRQITEGEDEMILQYREMTPEIEHILKLLNKTQTKLTGWVGKNLTVLELNRILYIESVDGKTFAYTKEEVFRLDYLLSSLEQILSGINFFRCSKSMIVNIDKVESLKSLPSNRIDATMCNGEHIIISRTYASAFRKRLKGGVYLG
ncbi:MAG: LytTR family transcriptional regulator DNA-binding domain-containing protein [Coprococcus sp.]|nr:LytTR family transcriptional regulator DNA-binding domain-containing protein [Coprococcus sp.]